MDFVIVSVCMHSLVAVLTKIRRTHRVSSRIALVVVLALSRFHADGLYLRVLDGVESVVSREFMQIIRIQIDGANVPHSFIGLVYGCVSQKRLDIAPTLVVGKLCSLGDSGAHHRSVAAW